MTAARAQPPHDEDRLGRLYRQCKSSCVAYARRLLAASGSERNRHLAAFDAEEFYDEAWVIYHNRREYLADHDHVAYLNALVRERIVDQRRRSQARKRTVPGPLVDLDRAEPYERATVLGSRLADRDHLRRLLAAVANPADARALLDHEVGGMTFAEIAAGAGITAEAARRRVHRARAQARAEQDRTGGSDD
jgi:RNA polymerase sigma factor (sigma-70 family)